jgi:hypothetical protein
MGVLAELFGFRIKMIRFCFVENGNKPSGSGKRRKTLQYLMA